MFAVKCRAPGCEGKLPENAGRGGPRRWCSVGCQRKAAAMSETYRRGVLGVLAEQWRAFGYPDHGDKMDAWSRLFDDFEKSR